MIHVLYYFIENKQQQKKRLRKNKFSVLMQFAFQFLCDAICHH